LEIELSDCEAQNTPLKGDHVQQVVQIVIGAFSTVLEVRCISLVM
jgi:hypothetical protein